MIQAEAERTNSTTAVWEPDPWDTPDKVADFQLAGFRERAGKAIIWTSARLAGPPFSGIDMEALLGAAVECYATHDGEDMLLVRSAWHGYPDPPEWKLLTRPGESQGSWKSWGHFAELPDTWRIPASVR